MAFRARFTRLTASIEEIQGLPAYPLVTEVKEPIDLAIIAIPIRDVPDAMRECGQAGIGAAIIISAGGQETGPRGKEIEAAIKAEAQKAGIRYLGPNCLGLLCPSSKLHASFAPHCAQPGNLAFISQSGALCSSILGWAIPKKIGFSHFISVGSMADVDFGDLIDYLGNEETRQEHRHLHGEPDPAPQVHERGPLRVPGQTHHRH